MKSITSVIRSSLYLKMMLPFVAFAVLIGLIIFRFLSHEATVRNEKLILSLVDTARSSISLAAEADSNISSINRITQAIASHLKIEQVYVISQSNLIIAANLNLVVGNEIDNVLSKAEYTAWRKLADLPTNETIGIFEADHFWFAVSRIYLIDPNIKRLRPYLLWTKIDSTPIEAQSLQDFYRVLFGALLFITLFACIKFWIQRYTIVRPLQRITKAIKSKQVIAPEIIARQGNDAIGLVAKAYNQVLLNTIEQEHRLELSRKYIDDITLHAPVLLAYFDTDLRIRFANKKYQQMLAPNHLNLEGQTLEQVLSIELLEQIAPYAQAAISGDNALFEVRYSLEHSHETIFLRVSHIPSVSKQGDVEGFFVCMEDITYLKRSEEKLAEFAAELEFNNWSLEEAKEQAENASKAKADFLATMSHEIRTPMNGVLGMLALLKEESLNETQAQQVDIAASSALLLMRIINDILDFSKIESGKLELDMSEFVLPQLVKDTVSAQAMRAHEKHVEVIIDDSDLHVLRMESDSVRLQQILTNLLGNAIKFTNKGQIIITLSNDPIDGEHTQLLLSVKDSGIGIPIDKQDVIFEHFSQADTSTTRQFGGTGLGLTIVRRLCELLNGHVWVESEVGVGSTFFVSIPVKTSGPARRSVIDDLAIHNAFFHTIACHPQQRVIFDKELHSLGCATKHYDHIDNELFTVKDDDVSHYYVLDIDKEPLSNVQRFIDVHANHCVVLSSFNNPVLKTLSGFNKKLFKPSTTHDVIKVLIAEDTQHTSEIAQQPKAMLKRILIVDDTPINQIVASKMLSSLDADIEFAANGEEALNVLKEQDFDVILMDCLMPVMDGYETTKQIRAGIIPNKIDIPIIAMTANAMSGDKEKCFAAGMTSYVSKPLDKNVLISTIADLLETS